MPTLIRPIPLLPITRLTLSANELVVDLVAGAMESMERVGRQPALLLMSPTAAERIAALASRGDVVVEDGDLVSLLGLPVRTFQYLAPTTALVMSREGLSLLQEELASWLPPDMTASRIAEAPAEDRV